MRTVQNGTEVLPKRQPPALSREANTEVTKTAIHQLAAGGWLQKGVNPTEKTCLQPGAKNYFDLYS